jgi:hypothetical protein
MNMVRVSLVAVLAFGASPLMAHEQEMSCNFVSECYESEACSSTEYEVSFSRHDKTDPFWKMSDVNAQLTANLARAGSSTTTFLMAEGTGATHIMMIGQDGSVRYVNMIHEGPQTITYHGTCGKFE